jgi:hypothetical protein
MEYADQTLAELLTHRALTDGETREMLLPVVDALAYLHRQELVQGQLRPANILVVGDQLKLSSDTVRRLSEGATSTHAPTAYDPPEARQGSTSPAGDIWALGITLCEALTCRLPSGLSETGEAPVLPADFSPAFRDIVTRCLSPDPDERPGLRELAAFARGQPMEIPPAATGEGTAPTPSEPDAEAPVQDAAVAAEMAAEGGTVEVLAPEPATSETHTLEMLTPEPETSEAGSLEAMRPEPSADDAAPAAAQAPAPVAPLDGWTAAAEREGDCAPPEEEPAQRPAALGAILGVLVIVGVVWAGVHIFRGHSGPAPPIPPVQTTVAPVVEQPAAPVSAGSISRESAGETTRSSIHEFIPEVPSVARRSVRGHIKVWVRVIVNRDGSVFAATPDKAGTSRYFERLALESAKKWTFPAADAPSQRLMQIRFDFSREGVTARSVTLR